MSNPTQLFSISTADGSRQIFQIIEQTRSDPPAREARLRELVRKFAAEGCISLAEQAANQIPKQEARAFAFRDLSNALQPANPLAALEAAKKIPSEPIRNTQLEKLADEWAKIGNFELAHKAVEAVHWRYSLDAIERISKERLGANPTP